MLDSWMSYHAHLSDILGQVAVTDRQGVELPIEQGFSQWKKLTEEVRRNDNTAYLIGNGASASMASHFSTDLAKNAAIRTHVLTDPSQLTAIANDIAFEMVYAVPLSQYAQEEDLVICISSSGLSPNILAAADAARKQRARIVTLTGYSPLNPLRQKGDINIHVPVASYGIVETSHAALLHYWMDSLVKP